MIVIKNVKCMILIQWFVQYIVKQMDNVVLYFLVTPPPKNKLTKKTNSQRKKKPAVIFLHSDILPGKN